jgi:hypothetical protein
MVTASVMIGAVADAGADSTIDAGTIAVARSANQRTVFMVGQVLTPGEIVRGDLREPLMIDRLPAGGQRR